MIKKLSKYGNSLALIIDKPILELLNITEGTPLKISTDGKIIIITPGDGDDESAQTKKIIKNNKRAEQIIEELTEEYSEALEKLAKN